MSDLDMIRSLTQKTGSKIVLLVMDGLGGLPRETLGPTELEAADTPHMNRLAREGMVGLMYPVGIGISPGSGPGPSGTLRVRSHQVPHRERCAGGGRDRFKPH